MKKFLALILATALMLTAAAVLVSAEDEEEPDSYFWINGDAVGTGGVNQVDFSFRVPGTILDDGEITVTIKVKFEDVSSLGGYAYLNMYAYDTEEGHRDFPNHLMSFKDYKQVSSGSLDWAEYTYTANPYNGSYGSFSGKHQQPGFVALGFGFYLAKGLLKVAEITVEQNSEVIWNIDFSTGLDFEKDANVIPNTAPFLGITYEDRDTYWGIQTATVELEESKDASVEESEEESVEESEEESEEESVAEPVEESQAPYDPEAPEGFLTLINDGTSGEPSVTYTIPGDLLDGPVDIEALVYFGEDCVANGGCAYLNIYPWDAEGNLLHWTDYAKDSTVELGKWQVVTLENWDCSSNGVNPDKATLTAGFWQATGTLKVAYIKVSVNGDPIWEVDYADGFDMDALSGSAAISADTKGTTWNITSNKAPEEESQGTAPVEESQAAAPVEESKGTAHTGDAGIIALAVVSVLALGGAIVVKKSK